jgi:hypothetical protein
VSRHQANHARIVSLRAQVEALEEQKKSSVSTLATLRHELHETPATTFPTDTRPVRFDELLQFAKNISQHTVPPTYRERAPEATSDKDKEKDDATSSSAPTNGVNTPVHVPALPDTDASKDGDNAENKPVEVTAAEEEWLKKLNESQIAWYPWPSKEKIEHGNLYKLMYWQARGKDVDEFDIPAHEEAEKKGLSGTEPPTEPVQAQEPQPQAPRPARPAQPQATFDMFDDLDD